LGKGWGKVNTLEGEVCKLADTVAYINHDIGDAIRAGIIIEDDLPFSAITILGNSHSQRINTMVCDIINCSWAASGCDTIEGNPTIGMSPQVLEATNNLREFLFARVYNVCSSEEESKRAREGIRLLYNYFTEHEGKLPSEYRFYSDEIDQRVVDYIAGMTDQYALRMAEELSLIKSEVK